MIPKLEREWLTAQIAALDAMLASLPVDDYLGRMGFESRREELVGLLVGLEKRKEPRAKVALFFGGEPVLGSQGVEAGFGSSAVGSFQDLLARVSSGDRATTLPARGPIPGRAGSQLHITSLLHGSFGFLLEELGEQQELFGATPLSKAAERTAEYIANIANEDEQLFSEAIEAMNSRVFQGLKNFVACVQKAKATVRIVEGERDETFDRVAVQRAWDRMQASDVDEQQVELQGTLLGVVPHQRLFEFEADGSPTIIDGKVGKQFSQSYLENLGEQAYVGKRWKAVLRRRKITKVGRAPSEVYTLLGLDELPAKSDDN